jgi:hypothetical protein
MTTDGDVVGAHGTSADDAKAQVRQMPRPLV